MVSLIIVDYKTILKTLEYINSCYQIITDSICFHTIVVDNAEDSSIGLEIVKEITQKEPEKIINGIEAYQTIFAGRTLLYICAKQNLGYAKGNNLGAKVAAKYYGDDYYLFSNNDLCFQEKFAITDLLEPMQRDGKIAVVGPNIKDLEGKQQSPRKKNSAWNQLFLNYYDLLLPKGMKITDKITDVKFTQQSQNCYWVTGSFMIVDAIKFREVDGFDEGTFLYCEEMILAERLQRFDYSMYYKSDIKVIHEHGQTVKNIYSILKGIEISFQSSLYYYKNYRKISKVLEILAEFNFKVFAKIFAVKKWLGNRINDSQ